MFDYPIESFDIKAYYNMWDHRYGGWYAFNTELSQLIVFSPCLSIFFVHPTLPSYPTRVEFSTQSQLCNLSDTEGNVLSVSKPSTLHAGTSNNGDGEEHHLHQNWDWSY